MKLSIWCIAISGFAALTILINRAGRTAQKVRVPVKDSYGKKICR